MDNIIYIKNTEANATVLVRNALKNVKKGVNNIIKFEKSVYHFYKEGCYTGVFYTSNNISGEKNVIFPILNIDNLTIDGNDSEFVFCDVVYPFVSQNCSNIKLKNFSVDFAFVKYSQAKVVSSDNEGFELKLDKSVCDYEIKNNSICFKTGNEVVSSAQKRLFLKDLDSSSVQVAFLYIGECREYIDYLPAPAIFTDIEDRNDTVYFKFRDESDKKLYPLGDNLYIGFSNRLNGVFFSEWCKNLRFENLTLYNGTGMGFLTQLCKDVEFEGIKIFPKEGRSAIYTLTADAIHSVNCSGQFIVKNSFIKNTVDDAVNIHGVYSAVDDFVAENKIRIKFMHDEQKGLIPYCVGDEIHISDAETMKEKTTAVVTKVEYDENRNNVVLSLESSLDIKVGDIIENHDRMPEVYFENNRIVKSPSMRFSSSKKTVIKNNNLSLQRTDIEIIDLFAFWYESGVVNDMLICDNVFEVTDSKCNIQIKSDRIEGSNHFHKNITIKNNVFKRPLNEAIVASECKNVVVKNNIVC